LTSPCPALLCPALPRPALPLPPPAVCPRGFFLASDSATTCTRCTKDNFCPGGEKVEQPANGLGRLWPCGDNLVTRGNGSRTQADCLAPAGYARTTPSSATACGRSEYAPAFNRLSKCLRCQSGLEEPLTSNLNATAGDRKNKRAVCRKCLPRLPGLSCSTQPMPGHAASSTACLTICTYFSVALSSCGLYCC
jgi:hypothetical protein